MNVNVAASGMHTAHIHTHTNYATLIFRLQRILLYQNQHFISSYMRSWNGRKVRFAANARERCNLKFEQKKNERLWNIDSHIADQRNFARFVCGCCVTVIYSGMRTLIFTSCKLTPTHMYKCRENAHCAIDFLWVSVCVRVYLRMSEKKKYTTWKKKTKKSVP